MHSIRVVVASPKWIKPPASLNITEGETATFTCEAEGIPQPDVTWYINGQILNGEVNGLSPWLLKVEYSMLQWGYGMLR